MVIIDRKVANVLFDIVVEECGALELDREDYVRYATSSEPLEYRFGGLLGFGGKIYHNGDRVYVSCYVEDFNETRSRMITRANARIAELLQMEDD